jgi:hypothetical protein
MKKIFFLFFVVFFCGLNTTELFAQKWEITIKCKLHRPKKKCQTGVWLCDCSGTGKVGNLVEVSETDDEGGASLMLTLSEPQKDEKGELAQAFFAESDESITIYSDEIKKAGYQSLTFIPGNYPIDYSVNKNGIVIIKGKLNK